MLPGAIAQRQRAARWERGTGIVILVVGFLVIAGIFGTLAAHASAGVPKVIMESFIGWWPADLDPKQPKTPAQADGAGTGDEQGVARGVAFAVGFAAVFGFPVVVTNYFAGRIERSNRRQGMLLREYISLRDDLLSDRISEEVIAELFQLNLLHREDLDEEKRERINQAVRRGRMAGDELIGSIQNTRLRQDIDEVVVGEG